MSTWWYLLTLLCKLNAQEPSSCIALRMHSTAHTKINVHWVRCTHAKDYIWFNYLFAFNNFYLLIFSYRARVYCHVSNSQNMRKTRNVNGISFMNMIHHIFLMRSILAMCKPKKLIARASKTFIVRLWILLNWFWISCFR